MNQAAPARLPLESTRRVRPFRRAVLSGLGIVMPPLLTIVILVWVWNTLKYYVLEPVTAGVGQVLMYSLADVPTSLPDAHAVPDQPGVFESEGKLYRQIGARREFVPLDVYETVIRRDGPRGASEGGWQLYRRYIEITYLRSLYVVPIFLCVFVLLMYLLGNFFAAGLGEAWAVFEQGIDRLPVVGGVYASVKQVTDFMLTKNDLQFTRVVAVEYPSRGIWSLAFVTGEGMPDIAAAVGEPVLSLLVPTSPVPVTGYTAVVLKREVIDLDMTIDQAIQYIVSCGVVVPAEQLNAKLVGSTPA